MRFYLEAVEVGIHAAEASDTELRRSYGRRVKRLYDEAAATIMARYTYDGHDCLTLTGTHSGMA